jgi:hypothetical protein
MEVEINRILSGYGKHNGIIEYRITIDDSYNEKEFIDLAELLKDHIQSIVNAFERAVGFYREKRNAT